MTAAAPLSESTIPGLELLHRGKVRDVYQVDKDRVLLVATDRISAFDCILPTLIPRKGEVLTQLSSFWFHKLSEIAPNHLITADTEKMPPVVKAVDELKMRSTLARRTEVFPVECVVRGYLEGSGWKDYQATGSISGHILPPGLRQCDKLLEPIFTPSTKATTGHDENISGLEFKKILGTDIAAYLKATS
jgi:phosphoribosylaminoimidazole-succinocarboxamide synthase